jgi:hypothetical protein
MKCHQSPAEARHEAQRHEHGPHRPAYDLQGTTAAQARRRYLQMAGGGLVSALLGSVTRPAEVRTRDGQPLLCFNAVPDGARQPDEAPTTIRVEYLGEDAESLAPRLVKSASIYCEGRLSLNTWAGRDGAERTGLNIRATHVEILGASE